MPPAIRTLAAVLCLATGTAWAQDTARALARAAFQAIEDKPFVAENLKRAAEELKRAERIDPREPWVPVAASRLILEAGYRAGSRFDVRSYDDFALSRAEELARHAVKLGPGESIAHSQLARILLIRDKREEAAAAIATAERLDGKDFYPAYLRARVAFRERAEPAKVKVALEASEARAKERYQKRFAMQDWISYARALKDAALEEKYHRASLAIDPADAHATGNYGGFLLRNGRVDEAIAALEKALSITRYPMAEQLLEKARRMKAGK